MLLSAFVKFLFFVCICEFEIRKLLHNGTLGFLKNMKSRYIEKGNLFWLVSRNARYV